MRVVFYTLGNSFPDRPFFNLRTDVYSWMVDHWDSLCEPSKDKIHNWRKQVQDMLSHSKNLFESGTDHYKQNGFWRLKPSIDIDPWTIRKPQRDKSKVATPIKKSRSHSESDLYGAKRLRFDSIFEEDEDGLEDLDIKDYLLENDTELIKEVESINNEINYILNKVKELNACLASTKHRQYNSCSQGKSIDFQLLSPTTVAAATSYHLLPATAAMSMSMSMCAPGPDIKYQFSHIIDNERIACTDYVKFF
ncbi:hypothetical protein SAMD00019534_105620 [Acytostelium subglobosum LB1]|uniref:hypothetical protein n=1 Tax=Acytostelium subglobosum LB1 TaxID=1410327 RepID=UPI0006447BB1|nr:hypothetical protein SAMD00019534_105620 [Acytostelium subglobosum LB1]GAM27387.1 hypothetical protein SAMD00019534_105620 [Acytostelium subglobosum LB1]|eukprot:XP_012749854.1 hypothetical protein SAMD00019534_105620 [Acytostelium subglobosum LB1]